MKRASSLLLALSFIAAPRGEAWAAVVRAAGAARAGLPAAGPLGVLPGAGPFIGALSPAALPLTAPLTVAAPGPRLSVPGAALSPAPGPLSAPRAAPASVLPAAGLAAAAAAPAPAAARAAHDAPVTAAGALDSLGREAASLAADAGKVSDADAKSRAAFEAPSARRDALSDPFFTGPVAFGLRAPRLAPVSSLAHDAPAPAGPPSPKPASELARRWDRVTQTLTDFAALPFLALQAPQIWTNVQNLLASHPEALANLPWIGYSTGILGNMLLLGWFASQKETSAARVQAIGVATSAVVVAQIFLAGHMPAAAFATVLPAVVAGLLINYLKFKDQAPAAAWTLWSKGTSLLGLVVLPQVLWSTFAPAAYASPLPAAAAAVAGLALSFLDSRGRLPPGLKRVWDRLGAWTATVLFMYGPIAQIMANLSNPAGMAGIALGTLGLAMAGNLLMLPRALHTRNWIWFTGSAWAVFVGGYGVLAMMSAAGFAPAWMFWLATLGLPVWLGSAYLLSRLSRR